MKRRWSSWIAAVALCASFSAVCKAHFLWLVPQDQKVHVYFSEAAVPDEPALLDRVKAVKVFSQVREGRNNKFTEVAVTKGKDSLEGTLPEGAQNVVLSHQYGILTRGEESFVLMYYAKAPVTNTAGPWQPISDVEHLPLEVTPRHAGKHLEIQVTWQGKPVADAQVMVDGGNLAHFEAQTNAEGIAVCDPGISDVLSIRARHMEAKSGELDGKKYTGVRHYSTVSIKYEQPQVLSLGTVYPALEKGITSFGGAIAGDHLYVYGGHFGRAHGYTVEEQSNEFRRLSLSAPNAKWETISTGPKLTGLALVAYKDQLYRVGGFTVKNHDGEDQNLVSQSSFAKFDPATQAWTDLPALPSGRSSHDAAVLDGKLYVIGGWELQGADKDAQWHTTALVCDLNQPELKWTEIAAPAFQRRALSLASHKGKIYVIGGMDKDSGPSTRVDVYDPAQNRWVEGPALKGSGMDGFGNSSFEVDGKLLATTMSGTVLQLSDDGSNWNVVGQLKSPRFFHRLLPLKSDAIIVGGASMRFGKANDLERLQFLAAEKSE